MKIFNQTRKATLAEDVFMAGSFLKRVQGLLGKKVFNYGQAIVLKPCNSIHTFFMRFPIDILFIGKDNTVVKAISGLKSFRLSPVCFKSKFVIELPPGTIKFTSTQAGDRLTLK